MPEQTKPNLNSKETKSKIDDKYGAILLCGGKGTRLRDLTHDEIPKPLVRIQNKELIMYSIELMHPSLVNKLVFAVDYMAEQVIDYAKKLNLPTEIEFSFQKEPEVLYAVKEAAAHIEGNKIIFCNTDEIRLNLRLNDVILKHETSNALASVISTYENHLDRHSVLEIDNNGTVLRAVNKNPIYASKPDEKGLVIAGLIVMRREALDYSNPKFGKDWYGIIEPLIEAGELKAYIDSEIKFFN